MISDSELTIQAREIARTLTYNDDRPQSAAKHMLLELAHRLDTKNIRVHRKRDGLLLINGIGKARFATARERILYRVFGVLPDRV